MKNIIVAIAIIFLLSGMKIITAEVKYIGGQFRDPFKSYLPKKELGGDRKLIAQELGKLKITGIIWDTDLPLAIINDKIYKVGDLVSGSKILEIGKRGVLLEYKGETYLLRPK